MSNRPCKANAGLFQDERGFIRTTETPVIGLRRFQLPPSPSPPRPPSRPIYIVSNTGRSCHDEGRRVGNARRNDDGTRDRKQRVKWVYGVFRRLAVYCENPINTNGGGSVEGDGG